MLVELVDFKDAVMLLSGMQSTIVLAVITNVIVKEVM